MAFPGIKNLKKHASFEGLNDERINPHYLEGVHVLCDKLSVGSVVFLLNPL